MNMQISDLFSDGEKQLTESAAEADEIQNLELFSADQYEEPWKKHWKGMPEYVQEDLMPYRTIYLHFECDEDAEDFAKVIGQSITDKTKYLWYPEVDSKRPSNWRYVDES